MNVIDSFCTIKECVDYILGFTFWLLSNDQKATLDLTTTYSSKAFIKANITSTWKSCPMYFPGWAISLLSFEVKFQPIISELDLVFSVASVCYNVDGLDEHNQRLIRENTLFINMTSEKLLLSYTWLFPEHQCTPALRVEWWNWK